jgi:SAM-dependent methyltransferase
VAEKAAYDGLADWYDGYVAPQREHVEPVLRDLLGRGRGRCLDIGCGGGAYVHALVDLGWDVIGIDVSADQLRVAQERAGDLAEDFVQADATDLPFEDESFDAAVALGVSTDVEPWEQVVLEAARVLRSGSPFVHVGVHPCLVGPHSLYQEEGDTRVVGSGYRDRSRQFDRPNYSRAGLRAKVGAVHVPLDDLLNAVLAAGFAIIRVIEAGGDPPFLFALRAERTG